MTVTVRYTQPASASRRRLKAESVEKTLTLNAGNYDVLQVLELPVGQEVDVTVEGSGKAIMTVGTVWHTRAMPSEPTFLVGFSHCLKLTFLGGGGGGIALPIMSPCVWLLPG